MDDRQPVKQDDGLVPARDAILAELLSMGFDISVATEAIKTQGIVTLADAAEFLLAGNSTPSQPLARGQQNSKPTFYTSACHGASKPATSSHMGRRQKQMTNEEWKACSDVNAGNEGLFVKAENASSKHFGFSRLKPFQMDALKAWANQQDCLVLAATGSGKSLCFQLPAGKDGHMYSVVYVCPETLPRLINSVKELACKRGIALFAIDEAHCISKWGHDFQPHYRRLSTQREVFKIQSLPGLKDPVPIMALTATATDSVQLDIMKSLKMDTDTTRIVRTTLFRSNLAKGHLRRAHEQFHLGTLQVIVATIAFGMGIDKPDVRHIIHYGWPQALQAHSSLVSCRACKHTIRRQAEQEETDYLLSACFTAT
ncbi:hypothetical protein L7F22_036912 [Adiantum nelumboides]|nr:hypothetical protein [Adiantum nelumboides]